MRYDINKLKTIKEYDVDAAVKNFASEQEFFDALKEFADAARGYLRMYNPTLVIYSNDIRADFLVELEQVEQKFNRIGVRLDGREIENISGAVSSGNEKVLSDGLVKFYAKMEIMARLIEEAFIEGNVDTAEPQNLGPAASRPHINETATVASRTVKDSRPCILAVDDMPQMLATITGILDESYNVIAVTGGKQALKALEAHTPAVILLDIEMPDMNGFELAGAIRKLERFEQTPILFLTAKRSRDYVLAAKALSIDDYVLKPIDKGVLLNKIERVLES